MLLRIIFKIQFKEWLNYYLPIEHDHSIPKEQKVPILVEWWKKWLNLTVETQLLQETVKKMVKTSKTNFKSGCKLFLESLEQNKIPILIVSAGLGNIIQERIRLECGYLSNMKIVSNFMKFDLKTKKIVGFEGKINHVLNKNESVMSNLAYAKQIETRSNVLLLGDSLADVDMADGLHASKNVLKIGFLNNKVDELLPSYMITYDIVLINDETFNILNAILKAIL